MAEACETNQRQGSAVSNEQMTYRDLLELVELIKSSSDFREFHLKLGELEVDLTRGDGDARNAALPQAPSAAASPGSAAGQRPPAAPAAQPSGASAAQASAHEEPPRQRHGHVGGGEIVMEAADPAAAPAAGSQAGHAAHHAHSAPIAYPPGAVLIKSPMVGTFYRSPEPGARPFVEVGQEVEADATVCIIEVMKLMNSIPAGQKGTVTHVLAEDGEPVEYGQVLMVVAPA